MLDDQQRNNVFTYLYRPKNCTIHLIVSPSRIVKVLAREISAKDDECFEFICGSHSRPIHAQHLGGRPVGIQLQEEKVKYFIWDRLGKSGRSTNPIALHYDPRIKNAFLEKGVQVRIERFHSTLRLCYSLPKATN
jgi:hypothetical protein